MFGEMGERLLLEGAFVRPATLESLGFRWVLPDLEQAFRFETGRFT
jgi:NAD dependent epimerase/dehydratase family enzyme